MQGLYVARSFSGLSRRFACGSIVTADEVEADGRDPAALIAAQVLRYPLVTGGELDAPADEPEEYGPHPTSESDADPGPGDDGAPEGE